MSTKSICLSTKDRKLVRKVATAWCRRHSVPLGTDEGCAAEAAVTCHVLAGERCLEALYESIRSHMAIDHYKRTRE